MIRILIRRSHTKNVDIATREKVSLALTVRVSVALEWTSGRVRQQSRHKCTPQMHPLDYTIAVRYDSPSIDPVSHIYTLFASKNFLSHPRVTYISISFHVGLEISYFTCRVNLFHVCCRAIRSTIYRLSLMRDCKI